MLVCWGFRGVAVHDAWRRTTTYADVEHSCVRARAARVGRVADVASGDADWCWATQAADASWLASGCHGGRRVRR